MVTTGFIKGYVKDSLSKAPINGALVNALNTTVSYTTGSDGAYILVPLIAGSTYTVRAQAAYYQTKDTQMTIPSSGTLTKNILLASA